MAKIRCTECGEIFDENLNECPNCACPASECEKITISETNNSNAFFKTDWANKIYKCGALFWDTFSKRYFQFSGRAPRIEYWSFVLISIWLSATSGGLLSFIIIIPLLAVSVRRFHDINRSGWWILVPWVSIFFQFKKSDEGANDYGVPFNINI